MSYALLTMVFVIILLLFCELFSDSGSNKVSSKPVDFDDLMRVKYDHHLITAWYILMFGYSLQFMVFPTYAELE